MKKPLIYLAIALSFASVTAHAARRCPAPAPVAAVAPAAPEIMTIQADALFGFGKSSRDAISENGRASIDRMMQNVNKNYSTVDKIEVVGHADAIGNPVSNQKLSEARAQTVGKLLSEHSPSVKIDTSGAGSTQPVSKCAAVATPENISCNAPNRRVDIKVYGELRITEPTKLSAEPQN
jgi:OOP family OmpA-OmpF porin